MAAPRTRRRGRPPAGAPSTTARLRELAGFVAPTTVITALLVYFGYVGTRARLAYFGVYLDLADLSNRALVLYGLEVVYVPAALVFLAVLLAVAVHALVSWQLAGPVRTGPALACAAAAGLVGVLLVARAVLGILVVRVSTVEVPGTTPLALAVGSLLLGYAVWIAGAAAVGFPARLAGRAGGPAVGRLRRVGAVAVAGLVVCGLFWAANSFAAGFGVGRAVDDARRLPGRPEVVLDTRDRLVGLPDGVVEAALPADGAAPAYRYRYRGLRLLLQAGGRLYLVPADWTDRSRTIVLPYDGQIRIQLVPHYG